MGVYALSKLVYKVGCISIDHALTVATADDPLATACAPLASIYTALTDANLTLQEKLCKGAYTAGMLMAQAHTQQKVISTLSGWYQRTITVVEQYATSVGPAIFSQSVADPSKEIKKSFSFKNNKVPWNIIDNNTGHMHYSFNGKVINLYRDPSKKYWWAKDITNHGGSYFKVFIKQGKIFKWVADADLYGNSIENKHKGPSGLFIKTK